jgi:hypothetical protein
MAEPGDIAMHVNKESVRVVVVVDGWRIEGSLHILTGSRLTDAVNSKAKDFLAVTDACIFDAKSGALLSQTEFLALNRDAISMIFLAE